MKWYNLNCFAEPAPTEPAPAEPAPAEPAPAEPAPAEPAPAEPAPAEPARKQKNMKHNVLFKNSKTIFLCLNDTWSDATLIGSRNSLS